MHIISHFTRLYLPVTVCRVIGLADMSTAYPEQIRL